MKTNLGKAQTFLEQKENKFFHIFHFLPDAVLLIRTSDKVVLDINAACEKLIGYRCEEIVGQTALKMVFFLDPDLWNRVFEKLESEKSIRDIETRILCNNSTIANVDISIDGIELDGQPCYLAIMRHIKTLEATKTATASDRCGY